MFHHYMQRGHALSRLMSLSQSERLFYFASMTVELEQGVGKCPLTGGG